MGSFLESALAYAAAGLYVFPLEPRGKRPLTKNGVKDATRDSETIRFWWGQWADANVAISAPASGLAILDVDVSDGKPGLESLRRFVAENGPLPPTMEAKTGSGGSHLIYRASEQLDQRLGFLPGLDLITKGYIVAPPSIHETGGLYEWVSQTPPVEAPPSLKSIARTKPEAKEGPRLQVDKGDRNNAMFSIAGKLHSIGLSYSNLIEALDKHNHDVCDPPLPRDEIEQIANSIQRYPVEKDPISLNAFAKVFGVDRNPAPTDLFLIELISKEPPIMTQIVPTSLPNLNNLAGGGFMTGGLSVLMAKPGAGKTALAINEALFTEKTRPVLYASTELSRHDLLAKTAGNILGASAISILKGEVSQDRIKEAVAGKRIAILAQEHLFGDGPPDPDRAIELITEHAIKLRDKYETPPLIIVDYLQDMVSTTSDNLRGHVGAIAQRLKKLAQFVDAPVLAISAVSRTGYGASAQALRTSTEASIYQSLAKESGTIDYAATLILHLDVLEGEDTWRVGRIAVAKSRYGTSGFAGVKFHGVTGRWEDYPDGVDEVHDHAVVSKGTRKDEPTDEELAQTVLDKVIELSHEPLTESTGPVAKSELSRLLKIRKAKMLKIVDILIERKLVKIIKPGEYSPGLGTHKKSAVVPIDYT